MPIFPSQHGRSVRGKLGQGATNDATLDRGSIGKLTQRGQIEKANRTLLGQKKSFLAQIMLCAAVMTSNLPLAAPASDFAMLPPPANSLALPGCPLGHGSVWLKP